MTHECFAKQRLSVGLTINGRAEWFIRETDDAPIRFDADRGFRGSW